MILLAIISINFYVLLSATIDLIFENPGIGRGGLVGILLLDGVFPWLERVRFWLATFIILFPTLIVFVTYT